MGLRLLLQDLFFNCRQLVYLISYNHQGEISITGLRIMCTQSLSQIKNMFGAAVVMCIFRATIECNGGIGF